MDFTVGRYAVVPRWRGKLYPELRRIDAETPRLIKSRYGNSERMQQFPKENVIGTFAEAETARALISKIHGIRGERDRRTQEANRAAFEALRRAIGAAATTA